MGEMQTSDPENEQEWQEAADAAEAFLLLDSARQYGLVVGGPEVDTRRCEEILLAAKRHGIEPAPYSGLET